MNKKEFVGKTVEEAMQKASRYFDVDVVDLDVEVIDKETKGLLGLFGTKEAKILAVPGKNDILEMMEEVKKEVPLNLEEKQPEMMPKEEVDEVNVEETQEEVAEGTAEVQEDSTIVEEEKGTQEEVTHEVIENVAKDFLEDLLMKMGLKCYVLSSWEDDHLRLEIEGENLSLVIGKRGKNLDAIQYMVSLMLSKHFNQYIRVTVDCENYRRKREESLIRLAHQKADKAKVMRKDIILNPMNAYERKIIHMALQDDDEVRTKSEGVDPQRKVIIFFNR